MLRKEMLEYKKCATTGKLCHYTEFTKSGGGWLASDGTIRHSQSKIGKRVNQALYNGLRVLVDGKLVSIGNKLHPNNLVWMKIQQEIKDEHPMKTIKSSFRGGELTKGERGKKAYIRMYASLGIEIPDLEKVLYKKYGRGSSNSDKCLDYLGIPKDETHREVRIGKYYVDGILDKTVYEFYGDYFHANPKIYSEQELIFNKTAGELWKKNEERANSIKAKGYNFNIIWESDWNDFQQGSVDELKMEN
jgi:hypothetical protein